TVDEDGLSRARQPLNRDDAGITAGWRHHIAFKRWSLPRAAAARDLRAAHDIHRVSLHENVPRIARAGGSGRERSAVLERKGVGQNVDTPTRTCAFGVGEDAGATSINQN